MKMSAELNDIGLSVPDVTEGSSPGHEPRPAKKQNIHERMFIGHRRVPSGMTFVWGRNDLSGAQVSIVGSRPAAVPKATEIARRGHIVSLHSLDHLCVLPLLPFVSSAAKQPVGFTIFRCLSHCGSDPMLRAMIHVSRSCSTLLSQV
jgi:hypothetical protein